MDTIQFFKDKYASIDAVTGDNAVTVCFLGDGAINIGPFHEGMCLAALWKLPISYIVENNLYAMGTPISRSMVTEDASIRALGYPMARGSFGGVDVVDVYENVKKFIDRARQESQPALIELKTYRYRGHSMADPGKYRTKEEVEEWKTRDPLGLAEERIKREFPELVSKLDNIRASVDEEVADAVQFAESSPDPDPMTVADYNYI